MKIDNTLAAKCGEARETRAEKAIRLLMSLGGDPKHHKLKEFEKFYPAVLHAMSRKVPRKTILKHLSEGGLKLYPALFEEFLSSMAKAYEDRGDVVTCNHCGQAIQPPPQLVPTPGDNQATQLPADEIEADATEVPA